MKNLAYILFKNRSYTPIPFIFMMLFDFNPHESTMYVGLVLVLLGELLRLWGVAYAGEITRTTSKVRAKSLVTDGPYSYIRNPLYLGNIIIYSGFGLYTNSFFPYLQIFVLAWFIFQYYLIIMIEEEFLENKFGKEYIQYKQNVPKLIPNIKSLFGFRSPKIDPNFTNALRSEMRTFQALFSVGLVTLIIYLVK